MVNTEVRVACTRVRSPLYRLVCTSTPLSRAYPFSPITLGSILSHAFEPNPELSLGVHSCTTEALILYRHIPRLPSLAGA